MSTYRYTYCPYCNKMLNLERSVKFTSMRDILILNIDDELKNVNKMR